MDLILLNPIALNMRNAPAERIMPTTRGLMVVRIVRTTLYSANFVNAEAIISIIMNEGITTPNVAQTEPTAAQSGPPKTIKFGLKVKKSV